MTNDKILAKCFLANTILRSYKVHTVTDYAIGVVNCIKCSSVLIFFLYLIHEIKKSIDIKIQRAKQHRLKVLIATILPLNWIVFGLVSDLEKIGIWTYNIVAPDTTLKRTLFGPRSTSGERGPNKSGRRSEGPEEPKKK
jgi:hypothetical protein